MRTDLDDEVGGQVESSRGRRRTGPTPREREILIGLGLGLGLALLVVTLGGIARAPSSARAGLSVGVSALMGIVPYQAWAGGGSLPPPVSGTASFRWVVSDAIGSSLVEIDATGTIVSRSAYKPFGGIEQQWGASGGDENGNGGTSGSGSRTDYAGHDRQTDTGLVYMNARWMDPGSGGFISVDPVISDAFEPMAYNGYSYVQNNPINGIDPTGMYTLHTYTVDLAATGLQVHVGTQEISEGGDSAGSSAGSSGGGGGGPGSGGGPAPAGPSGVSVSSGGGGATAGVSAAPAAGGSRSAQGSQPKGGAGDSGGGGTVWDGVEEFIVYRDSHRKFKEAQTRMDNIIANMTASMTNGPGLLPASQGFVGVPGRYSAPPAPTRAVDSLQNGLVRLAGALNPITGGQGTSDWQALYGLGWVGVGTAFLGLSVAATLGIPIAIGGAVVSAGGLGVAAAGFGAIGAMNLIVARELAANGQ